LQLPVQHARGDEQAAPELIHCRLLVSSGFETIVADERQHAANATNIVNPRIAMERWRSVKGWLDF